MKLNRRSFVKGSITAGSMAALGSLGIVAAQAEEGAEAEQEVPATSAGLQDGRWIGQAMGHRNKTTVLMDVSGGTITNLSILRCDDTIGIGSVAAQMMIERIGADQNLDVDVVSGATITSFAVKNAVEAAIEAAGGNPDDYHKGSPVITPGEDVTENVDVVVVGAGTAGLVAAARLLEAGKSVCVIEQLDIAGGSGPMTYSGILAMASDMQLGWSAGRHTEDNTYFNIDAHLDLLRQYYQPEDPSMPYTTAMYEHSAQVVNWMASIGVGFCTMGTMYFQEPVMAPGPYMGGSGYAMQHLADRIGALGGTIHYATTLTELIQDEDGTVSGIIATAEDGSTLTINAQAVCMTTGGFGNNPEMLAEYYPAYADAPWACCSGSTGEGMRLAVGAGAVLECMDRTLGAFNSTTPDAAGTRFELAFLHTFAPGMMVNNAGDEFGEGSLSHAFMGKAVLNPDNGGRFYHVTDHAGALRLEKMDTWGNCTDYACLFDRGDIVHYDSIDAAAEALNLPNLRATFDAHNQTALTGERDQFGRVPTFINENEGVWLVSCMPTFYLTTGGIRIDTSCHVLDTNGQAIPGLYAAGDICGSIEEKDGTGYAYGFDAALSYGFIMAETITNEG